MKMLDFDFV